MTITVALGTVLAPLNSTMIAVALPGIMDDFDIGVSSASWLITGYLILMASLQPVTGKIGDRLGRRPLVIGGLAAFGIASMAASFAPNLGWLLFFRMMQAVSGAFILPNGAALMREVVPESRRGREFGIIGAAVGMAAAFGPPLGGILAAFGGWQSIFYVNVLVIVPALYLAITKLPKTRPQARKSGFDLGAVAMLPAMLVGLVMVISLVGTGAGPGMGVALPIAVGVAVAALLVAFVLWELRHPDPVIQPRFFRIREFAAANAGVGLGNMAMYTMLISVPLLITARYGDSLLKAGFILIALSVASIVVAPFGGRLSDRLGRRIPAVVGHLAMVAGVLPMALAGSEVGIPTLVFGLALIGVGLGLTGASIQATAVESIPARHAGSASGTLSTSRYLGSIMGAALLAGMLGADRGDVTGLDTVFYVVLAAAIAATVVSFGLRSRPGRAAGGSGSVKTADRRV